MAAPVWIGLLVLAVGVAGGPAVRQASREGGNGGLRWCIPAERENDCGLIMYISHVRVACVSGTDRLDCLRKLRDREADFMVADPEDVYVASQFDNQDYVVFMELRSNEEPTAEFRYEGIMLVRAADNFHSLADLRGKRSCHTGFGRNVGYKIPVTRLQQAGVLKLPPADGRLSPVERELAALSELFAASCLPGSYSSDAGIERLLKGRYSNLCEQCADPKRCAKDDRYAGYDGAIRCLVENGGDVAFTKTIFVRKYFGLPLTPGDVPREPALNPEARPEDYAYLCEDGTTRPLAGPVCSWAQRPWQVLLGNGDLSTNRMHDAQAQMSEFYSFSTMFGREETILEYARGLGIAREAPLVERKEPIGPREYLSRANYVGVIEREGPYGVVVRLCVVSEAERQKCELLRLAAYSRDIRPALKCVLKTEDACVAAVRDGSDADVVVLRQPNAHLKALLWETYTDVLVAVGNATLTAEQLRQGQISYNFTDDRAVAAAKLLISKLPSLRTVNTNVAPFHSVAARIVPASSLATLEDTERLGMVLVCPDLTFQPLANVDSCRLVEDSSAAHHQAAVYVRKDVDETLQDGIVHMFTELSKAFGQGQPKEQVFRLFGPFRVQDGPVGHHLIFSDHASGLAVVK